MSDILLIQPPLQDFYFTPKRSFPCGLASLAAALKARGFEVELLDALATSKSRSRPWPSPLDYLKPFYSNSDRSPFALFAQWRHFGYSLDYLFQRIQVSRAFLVGISALFTAYSELAVQLAILAKKARPGCHTVLGGHHATHFPEALLAVPEVDYVIRGEGEEALPALAQALRCGSPLTSIAGLAFRRADGRLNINPPAVVEDLNDLPAMALQHVKLTYYQRHHHPQVSLVASRGCPLQCSYCSTSRDSGLVYRQRSLQSVLRDLDQAVESYGARFINFEDENLSLNSDWFTTLLQTLIQRYASRALELRAMNGLLPSTLTENQIALMRQAGFKTLNLALATTHEHQRRRFRRPNVREAFERALVTCQRYQLSAVGYILIAGPGQTAADSVQDLLYLAARPVLAALSPFYPSPGSRDWQTLIKQNIIPSDHGLLRASVLPLELEASRLETVTLLRLGRILNFMKLLARQGLLNAAPPDTPIRPDTDRLTIGRLLLARFLREGRIYGVTPEGHWFEHASDPEVCRLFLKGLNTIRYSL